MFGGSYSCNSSARFGSSASEKVDARRARVDVEKLQRPRPRRNRHLAPVHAKRQHPRPEIFPCRERLREAEHGVSRHDLRHAVRAARRSFPKLVKLHGDARVESDAEETHRRLLHHAELAVLLHVRSVERDIVESVRAKVHAAPARLRARPATEPDAVIRRSRTAGAPPSAMRGPRRRRRPVSVSVRLAPSVASPRPLSLPSTFASDP